MKPTGAAAVSLAAFDAQQLEQFTRRFEDLFYAADPGQMTAYYTRGARLMADGIRPLRGHAAIRDFWAAAIARAMAAGARRTIRLHESHSSGGLGYALCTVTIQIPPPGASPGTSGGTTRASWDATIWQRDPDGTWRIAVDISTPLPLPLPS
jgi:ketosteroid isomerase-like protein